MEWSSIIVALITGAVTLIGIIFNGKAVSKKHAEDEAVRNANTMNEIQNLKEDIADLRGRVDAHNKWGEKFSDYTKEVSIALAELKKDITYLRQCQ